MKTILIITLLTIAVVAQTPEKTKGTGANLISPDTFVCDVQACEELTRGSHGDVKLAHVQQDKPATVLPPPVVTKTLNPEASEAWQRIEDAKQKLRDQYAILDSQQAALLIGASVPLEARGHCLNDKGVVVCAVPETAKKP